MSFICSDTSAVLKKCQKVMETIRSYQMADKNTIVNSTKYSWATVNSYLDFLSENKAVVQIGNVYKLNESFAYVVGVSLGVTEIKLSILNFNFESDDQSNYICNNLAIKLQGKKVDLVNSNGYICINTPQNYSQCFDLCSTIIECILCFFESTELNLFSVGMSIPGIIDSKTHIIDFSPNLKWLEGIDSYSLIRIDLIDRIRRNGAFLGIYHDMDAVSVYEMERLIKDRKNILHETNNILCLYMTYGFGSTLIKNNSLRLFSSGEHGHIMASVIDIDSLQTRKKCACGQNCIESIIREKVFDATDIISFNNNTRTEKLQELGNEQYSILVKCIGFLINHIINTMRVDVIIISGRILNEISRLKYEMDKIKYGYSIKALSKKCTIINGNTNLDIAAAGVAMIACYNYISQVDPTDLIITW